MTWAKTNKQIHENIADITINWMQNKISYLRQQHCIETSVIWLYVILGIQHAGSGQLTHNRESDSAFDVHSL